MIDSSAQELTLRLADLMLKRELTLVTAESCTGGGIAHCVTSIAGSSGWFDRGFVTYTNEAKRECLNVSAQTLDRFGAVSEECAAEMVVGALQNSHADIAVSVTGIAGPDGGSKEKPVGTVCFGWCQRNQSSVTTRVVFAGDREQVRRQSVLLALQGLLDMLEA